MVVGQHGGNVGPAETLENPRPQCPSAKLSDDESAGKGVGWAGRSACIYLLPVRVPALPPLHYCRR